MTAAFIVVMAVSAASAQSDIQPMPKPDYGMMFDFMRSADVKAFVDNVRNRRFVRFNLITPEDHDFFITKDGTEIFGQWKAGADLTARLIDKDARIYSFRIRVPHSALSEKFQAKGLNETIYAYECFVNVKIKGDEVMITFIRIESSGLKTSFLFSSDCGEVLYQPMHLDDSQAVTGISPEVIAFYLDFGKMLHSAFDSYWFYGPGCSVIPRNYLPGKTVTEKGK